jgi:adenine-specific DNA methylase
VLVRDPITSPIHPQKQAVKRHFGSHPYFTRRPWNVVQAYIKHFAPHQDNVVLDPFGGSGVTAIEAIVLGKKAIHIDINPLANFICQQIAVAPIDFFALRREFVAIEDSCRRYIERLYSLTNEQLEQEPLNAWYPSGLLLPKNADARQIEELFTRRQLLALSRLYQQISNIEDSVLRDLIRFAFSATLNKCNLTYSTTHGRSEGRGNSGIMHTYRYWIPKNPVELNVWNEFNQKFRNLLRVKRETNQAIGQKYKRLKIIQASATQLTKFLDQESVDYIFTDPPYGSHIAYLDLSTMWNAWLGFEVRLEDKKLEVIEGGDLDKSRDDYAKLLQESLREMRQVLKWNSWLSIVFAHKDLSYWHVLIEAAQEAGFEYANTVVQESFQFSRHKRANPLSVLSEELILNFQKKQKSRRIRFNNSLENEPEFLMKQVEELLSLKEIGLTTEEIYNRLVPRLLEYGLLQNGWSTGLLGLNELLKNCFFYDESSSRWYKSMTAAQKSRRELDLIRANGQLALDFSHNTNEH